MEILLGVILEALLAAVVALLEILLGVFLQIFLGLLLLPVAIVICCAVSTPVILINAAFGPGKYLKKVAAGYRTVAEATPCYGGVFC